MAATEIPSTAGPARPAPAPARPFTERYFDTSVSDPYRWMEDTNDPELRTWLEAQDEYARQSIARDERRAPLEHELHQLAEASTKVLTVEKWGGLFFILRVDRSAQVARLFVRNGISGTDRLLIDPSALDSDGKHHGIDYFTVSPDGAYVALGVSANGAHDRSVLRIVEVKTGKWLEEGIERTILSDTSLSWMPDSKAFFYTQFSPPSGAAKGTVYEKSRVLLHRLGTDPASDRAFFGYGVKGSPEIGADDIPGITLPLAGRKYLFAQVSHGIEPEMALYVANAPTNAESQPVWRKLLGTDAAVTAFDVRGDDLYLLSHRASPKFQLLKTHVSSCNVAKAVVVADGGDAVIGRFGLASDAVYLRLVMDGGFGRVQVIPYDSGPSYTASTKQLGAIGGLSTNPLEPGVIFKVESWTRNPQWYVQSPQEGSKSDSFGAEQTASADGIESVEVTAPSKDGTQVPLTIIYKAGIKRDGTHPTVLKGYGSYGISLTPRFDPLILPWLERGGVWAIAHVRGGGERGEDWHRSGMKEHKQNTIDDFIACAHYLIDHSYTSSAKLAAEGTSAGGLLVAAAISQDPGLFGAAVMRVGVFDMLRFETMPNIGRINIPEFGTVKNKADFASLLRMSPYHHVRDGARYPAVLLMTGLNDPNAAPWHSAKMAARLQAASASEKPILLRVEKDAGHGSVGGTRAQEVARQADELAFLFSSLR
jgi:prolyl oligopeptidase